MASGVFADILQRALRAKGKNEKLVDAVLEITSRQKGLDLANTIVLRSTDEGGLTDSDILAAESAADDYVDNLLNDLMKGDLQELIDTRKSSKTKSKIKVSPIGAIRLKSGAFIGGADLARLLNSVLYRYAQDLMGSGGRLVNRTGRLAHSGVVSNISQKNFGGKVSLYFQYMIAPYSVFEPGSGNSRGSAARSPASLFKQALNNALGDLLTKASVDKFSVRWTTRGNRSEL
jgi:hypothetical protein